MEKEVQKRIQRIEELIHQIEAVADPNLRARAVDLVQSLLELQGAGINRMLEIAIEAGNPGQGIIERFGRDELVGGLLILHGLHPVAIETRVIQALNKVRPYLHSHGGDVELLGIDDEGVVRLKLQGSCKSCPSSAMTLKLAVEEAIYEAAPDITAIEAEGLAEQSASSSKFVQIGAPRNHNHSHPVNGKGWEDVAGLLSLAQSSVRALEVRGRSVLFCRLGETFYAYSNRCPGCEKPLHGAYLETTTLVCSTCGQQYDVVGAGRGLNQPNLHLEPYPLLVEQGQAKVALPPG